MNIDPYMYKKCAETQPATAEVVTIEVELIQHQSMELC